MPIAVDGKGLEVAVAVAELPEIAGLAIVAAVSDPEQSDQFELKYI